MATLDDVQDAMVDVIDAAIYPDGDDNPSILNKAVYILAGDPLKLDLDSYLAIQTPVIAVFAQKGMSRNTTRVRNEFADSIIDLATIILTINNNTITLTGTPTANQAPMIIYNGSGYAYKIQTGDTLNIIATHLANLIPGATALNNVITLTNVNSLEVAVSVEGYMRKILASHEGIFRARIYSSLPGDRKILGKAIEDAFAKLDPPYYLSSPDGISSSVRPRGIDEVNIYELDLAYVRDYLYLVEYHTVDIQKFHTITFPYSINSVS